jgi:flagellar hook-associated protein 2
MRISGIASGFDTDAMVKSMMAVERMKVDRFEKSKQLALWKQESYNTMNKAFANFILNTQKDMGLKKTGSTGTITNSSYKNVDYVKKATSSNEAAATVTSSGKAINGKFSFEVEKLATNASFVSKEIKSTDTFGKELKLKLSESGKEIKVENVDGSDITMKDIVKAINDSKQGVTALYNTDVNNNGVLVLQTNEIGSQANIDLKVTSESQESLTFLSNIGWTTEVKGDNSKIKMNGVVLEYKTNNINLNGVDIELKAEKTGPITINVSTNTEGIMEKIAKLVKDYNDLVDLASLSVSEKAYPGYQPLTAEERKAMSESDVKLWDEKAKSGLLNRDETIQRTLQSIRNDLYKTVEGLDPEFNHITKIGITTEKYSRGSAGGKLVIDTDKLKAAVEANPDAVMDLLFKEGPKKPYSESKPNEKDYEGDPEGYNAALKTYEEGLRVYEKTENANRKANNGIFTNIYENLITGMKSIIDKSGPGQDSDLLRGVKSNILIDFVTTKSSISDIDKSVQEMNRQMDNLNILLAKKEDSYYAKFTAMEKAMHQMNSQSGWLAQQFG